MIAPGATVTHRAFGPTRFVVARLRDDGLIDIASKVSDALGRVSLQGFPASPGDLTLVSPPPAFLPGATVQRNGSTHTVLVDHGSEITLVVGERSRPLRGGGSVRLAAGNFVTVAKSDLVIEAL